MSPIATAVLATLAYFDLSQVPLTALEVWRNLFWISSDPSPGLGEVEQELAALVAARRVQSAGDGFYALAGGPASSLRLMREADALFKWRRLRRGTRLLAAVPFLLGTAVVNTLPIGAARRESDIDLFLVGRAGRLFTVRLCAVALTALFGMYRRGAHVADQLCLSFFVSERALDLGPLAKTPEDPCFRFWYANFLVLAEREDVFTKMWQANQSLRAPLPNAHLRRAARAVRPFPGATAFRAFLERALAGRIGDRVETWARRVQTRRFSANAGSRAWQGGTDVVISDDVLKFHERDRREEVRRAWRQKLRRYAIPLDLA